MHRIRLPSPPPSCEGKNPCSNGGPYLRFSYPVIPLDDGTFCVLASLGDYDTEHRALSRKATYPEIKAWVAETYHEAVTNLDISRARKRCGLAQDEYKGRPPSPGYYEPKPRKHKEALVIAAFRHFGMI